MDVSHTHIWVFMHLPPRVVVPHTVSNVAARSVCFRCRLQPGLRLLRLTVDSHIFSYPSAEGCEGTAVPSHTGLICLAILLRRQCTRTSFLGFARQCSRASGQGSVLVPHLPPDNNAAETAHNRHREWHPIPGRFRFVL